MLDIEAAVDTVIEQTERYYREMIFSTGCSSIVAIYRITDHTTTAEALIKQLNGSPYIQKDIPFSERVVQALMDVDLYVFDGKHMFLQGDIEGEIAEFVDKCQKIASFDQVVCPTTKESDAKDFLLDAPADELIAKYPVLSHLDLTSVLAQIDQLSNELDFESAIDGYLQIFQNQDWVSKHELNRSSLICMVSIANRLELDQQQIKELITLGVLKDIGYARLQEHIQNFEVMHPLVSHKIVSDANHSQIDGDNLISQNLLDAILLHHEFADGSGPLARMKHPSVIPIIKTGIPVIAQISGICDLYLGFFEKYAPAQAFAITCGFVLGHGDVPPRYSPTVIKAFASDFKAASYHWGAEEKDASVNLIKIILGTLKAVKLQEKATTTICAKAKSEYDRITLALNLVRNIAHTNPTHIGEMSLINALHLPQEFGLNYS